MNEIISPQVRIGRIKLVISDKLSEIAEHEDTISKIRTEIHEMEKHIERIEQGQD